MTEKLDAQRVADDAATALRTTDDTTSKTMLQHVNEDLRSLSEPERNYVANDLALKGLLPDLAIETGLVSQENFVTKDALAKVAADEGNSTVNGMAAKFLTENFSALGGGPRSDTNADYVKGFDMRYDLALETANVKREFGGLLNLLKTQNPDNTDIQSRDGLQQQDIDALLSKPEALSPAQSDALKTMKNNFEYMKTPRGIWTVTDWTTPRVNEGSIGEFVNTALPLGMADQMKIAESEKSKQTGLQEAALKAQQARQTPPEAKPPEQTTNTPAPATEDPAVAPDAPSAVPPTTEKPEAPAPEVPAPTPEVPAPTPEVPAPAPEVPAPAPEVPAPAPEVPAPAPEVPAPAPEVPAPAPEVPAPAPEVPAPAPEIPAPAPEVPAPAPQVPAPAPDQPTQPETPKPEAPVNPEAPPVTPENPGDKPPTAPENMERDQLTDKEYTVASGDNLWKIARAHLAELEGKRPNNADVLKLVNEIVARNHIKNPNLIYPDQKFIIPGPAAKPKDVPAPLPAPSAPPQS